MHAAAILSYNRACRHCRVKPLHYASLILNLELTRMLIEHGADPNCRDSEKCGKPGSGCAFRLIASRWFGKVYSDRHSDIRC